MLANTPSPPYYAVIFSSVRTDDEAGYAATAQRMLDLAAVQPGFLGAESARNEIGITVSYWKDLDSIRQWKAHADHQIAQELGIKKWYSAYQVRICRVERAYTF
ncbi:MAG: antibiotic biosynthesis monooxygenase [Lewinellaceae bacterium]|nr:antibiotic biosynthesis monooxygenase [Lewinellaceae bacterium]